MGTLVQSKDKEKMRADKLEREKQPLNSKLEQLEADLKHALKMSDSKENNLSKDIAMFNQEISRLTKERDTTKTELDICKHDLRKVETDLKSSRDEITRLLSEKDKMTNGLEKGQKEVLECKDNEIKKLTGRVENLQSEVKKIQADKESLEKEKDIL